MKIEEKKLKKALKEINKVRSYGFAREVQERIKVLRDGNNEYTISYINMVLSGTRSNAIIVMMAIRVARELKSLKKEIEESISSL
jgi:cell division protein ZapA (FtsZ GTPase activity inhibitor)